MRTGIQTSAPGYVAPMHFHPYTELLFIIEGEADVWLQGEEDTPHRLKAGDCVNITFERGAAGKSLAVRIETVGELVEGRVGLHERLLDQGRGIAEGALMRLYAGARTFNRYRLEFGFMAPGTPFGRIPTSWHCPALKNAHFGLTWKSCCGLNDTDSSIWRRLNQKALAWRCDEQIEVERMSSPIV